MTNDEQLIKTLRDAQRFGFFGKQPIEEAIGHSRGFCRAIGDVPASTRLVDLGSGGGLPGLVVAADYSDISILLVDRRMKRTDFLERAVSRLRFEHVTVHCGDIEQIAKDVEAETRQGFGIVTARSFGPPETTLRVARRLLSPQGRIIISEPPDGDRWPSELLSDLGLRGERQGAVRVFSATA